MMLLSRLLIKSIRLRLVAFTTGVALGSSLLLSSFYDMRAREAEVESVVASLAAETRLTALQFRNAYAELWADALVASRMPPIEGLRRAAANAGVDPLDQSTVGQWRARVSDIFVSIMREARHYTQMRFIAADETGHEIVRVNRVGLELKPVAEEALQDKGAEPYVFRARKLSPGDVYFSAVSLNRENGVIDATMTPTLPVVVPTFAPDGEMFGMVVINANFEEFLRRALAQTSLMRRAVVFNEAGDLIERTSEGVIAPLAFRSGLAGLPADFTSDLHEAEKSFVDDKLVAFRKVISIAAKGRGARLAVMLEAPSAELFAAEDAARRETLWIAAVLALCAAAIAALGAERLVAPLRSLTRRVAEARDGKDLSGLPVGLPDEIGARARAFKEKALALEEEARSRAVLESATTRSSP